MQQILLAGGGHTHLAAVRAIADRTRDTAHIVLVSESQRLLYSGLMPGWLAGRHALADCEIDLQAVCALAGIQWVCDTLVNVDFPAQMAIGRSGRRYEFDRLSLNVGSDTQVSPADSSRPVVLSVKPFGHFVSAWQAWLDQAPAHPRCVVVGGGAAAFELACALQSQCGQHGPLYGGTVQVVTSGQHLLASQGRLATWLAERSLAQRGIRAEFGLRFVGTRDGAMVCVSDRDAAADAAANESEREIPADLVVLATGARTPRWLTQAACRDGLAVADDGGLSVDADLRVVSRASVWASGDCASFAHGLSVPKSGVHALKQAPVLVESLVATLDSAQDTLHTAAQERASVARYRPQRHALQLLDCGDATALACWGPWAASGALFWHWKQRIDRGFIAAIRQGLGGAG
jgi:NADH dehydrogenase FAD-containing subunit